MSTGSAQPHRMHVAGLAVVCRLGVTRAVAGALRSDAMPHETSRIAANPADARGVLFERNKLPGAANYVLSDDDPPLPHLAGRSSVIAPPLTLARNAIGRHTTTLTRNVGMPAIRAHEPPAGQAARPIRTHKSVGGMTAGVRGTFHPQKPQMNGACSRRRRCTK